MVEGENLDQVHTVANRIADAIRAELGVATAANA